MHSQFNCDRFFSVTRQRERSMMRWVSSSVSGAEAGVVFKAQVDNLFKAREDKLFTFAQIQISITDGQNPSSAVKCNVLRRHCCWYKLFAFATLVCCQNFSARTHFLVTSNSDSHNRITRPSSLTDSRYFTKRWMVWMQLP